MTDHATVDEAPNERAFSRNLRKNSYSPAFSLFILVTILVSLVAYLLYTAKHVDHTNHIIEQAVSTERILLDLQSASRGYYLTGDPSFLAPFNENRPELLASLARLQTMISDPAARVALDRINATSLRYVAYVDQVLAATKSAAAHTPSPEQLLRGKAEFEPARQATADFLSRERELRDARAAHTRNVAYLTLAATLVGTTITAIVQCIGVRRRIVSITETYRGALRIAKDRREHIKSLLVELDRELKAVGEIQRSLLPLHLPTIPGLQVAASYQTSRRAGGDYYDFFRLPPEFPGDQRTRFGILIADVSGHGTPAAVLMAVTHSIAHSALEPAKPPHDMLTLVNRRLCKAYTTSGTTFVTAFYAIFDPADQSLTYSSAGHNPPRLRRAGETAFHPLDDAQGLPLGVTPDDEDGYTSATRTLRPGDTLILYTDGITEARNPDDDELGVDRLDAILSASPADDPDSLLAATLAAVNAFSPNNVEDDRTVVILRATSPVTAPTDHQPRRAVIVESTDNHLTALKP